MASHITIASWNMNGISFLRTDPSKREGLRSLIIRQLKGFIEAHKPDFIAVQEIVRYEEKGAVRELVDPPGEYFYQPSISIDTARQNNPVKWEPIRQAGGWTWDAYLGQGNGLFWRKEIPHCSIWDLAGEKAGCHERLRQEVIRIDNGLFIGTRDTEPRIAVVSHFVCHNRHVFIVNLHLTTLSREREGFPERDDSGAEIREKQLDIVLNGIVSRHNQWSEKESTTTQRPIWFLVGDFNATEESLEIAKLKRLNFVDMCPDKGTGTKRGKNGHNAALTLDYIFAGPAYYAFDPQAVKKSVAKSACPPHYETSVSDHYPIVAVFPNGSNGRSS